MALIGTMKYLTIGDQTYEIAGDELQIASASTLGGIKVGSGLSIDATTGVLSTSITETDPTVPSWAKASTKPTYTYSEVGAAASSHSHGNITNGGDITATAPTIANGDQIIINDNSASKITNGPTFDGSTTTKALTQKGTWETFLQSFTESDPVFAASAAAGITSTDISNWNAKSDTDEKAKQIPLNGANSTKGLLFSDGPGSSQTINGVYTSNKLQWNDSSCGLYIYNTNATKQGLLQYDSLSLSNSSTAYSGRLKITNVTADRTYTFPDKTGTIALTSDIPTVPTKTSDLTNDSGYITSYTDEKVKWTASTSSNTYYPLQSTSTATTSTANTLNGISFYQYYNTAGGYRRLDLGNATAYKTTGGAYGTIRLYGAAATYYGDLVPGVLGTTSGDGHISANRTWTLPDKTGTIALTSDIPTVGFSNIGSNSATITLNSIGYTFLRSYTETDPVFSASAAAGITSTDISNWNTKSDTDEKVKQIPLNGLNSHKGLLFSNGQGSSQITNTVYTTDKIKWGDYERILFIYDSTGDKCSSLSYESLGLVGGSYNGYISFTDLSNNRSIIFPDNSGTVALTSDIPSYTDTNTTYTLTNALSSHKFTWTFTAGGSGSGSTTTTAELVAGTNITLTDDTTNKKITIASDAAQVQIIRW